MAERKKKTLDYFEELGIKIVPAKNVRASNPFEEKAEVEMLLENLHIPKELTKEAAFKECAKGYIDALDVAFDSMYDDHSPTITATNLQKTLDLLTKEGIIKDVKEFTIPLKENSDLFTSRKKLLKENTIIQNKEEILNAYTTTGCCLIGFAISKDLKCYKKENNYGKFITDEYFETKQFNGLQLCNVKNIVPSQELFESFESYSDCYYLWVEKNFTDGALYLMAESVIENDTSIEFVPVYRPLSARSGNLKIDLKLFAGVCCYCNSDQLSVYAQTFLQYLYNPDLNLFIEGDPIKKAEQVIISPKTYFIDNDFVKHSIGVVDKGFQKAKIQGAGKTNPITKKTVQDNVMQPFTLISNEEAIEIIRQEGLSPLERINAINSICRDKAGRPIIGTENQTNYFDIQIVEPAFYSLVEERRQLGSNKVITTEDICRQIIQDPTKKFNKGKSQLIDCVKESMKKQKKILMYMPLNVEELVKQGVLESEQAAKDLAYTRELIPYDAIVNRTTGEIEGYVPTNRMPLYIVANTFGGKRDAEQIEMTFKDVKYIEEKNGEKHEKSIPEANPFVIAMRTYLVQFIHAFNYSTEREDVIEFDKMFKIIGVNLSYENIKKERHRQIAISRQMNIYKQYFYALLEKQVNIGNIISYQYITNKNEKIDKDIDIKGKSIIGVKLIPSSESKRRKEELQQGAKDWDARKKAEKEQKAKKQGK